MKRLWNAALLTALAFGIALGASVPPAAVPSAQAAVPAAAQEWLDFLHSMYVKHLDESDKAAVQEARGKLLSDILAGGESNLDPLVQFLNDHSEQVFTNKKIAELVRAFAEAITFEDSAAEMGDKLAENLQHPPVRAALKKLLAPSGLELDGEDGVGIEDAVKFLEALRLELLEKIDPYDALSYLAGKISGEALAELKTRLKGYIQASFTDVLEREDLRLTKALAAYADGEEEQAALAEAAARTMLLLTQAYDEDLEAVRALVKGMVLEEGIELELQVSDNGRKAVPVLSVLGKAVPEALVAWEVEDGSEMITFKDGAFVLDASAAANTAYEAAAKAMDIFFGIVLWEGIIEMTYEPPSPAPGPIYVPAPAPDPAPAVMPREEQRQRADEAKNAVQDVSQLLENAAAAERSGMIRDAIGKAREQLNEIGRVGMSGTIAETEEGKAAVLMTRTVIAGIVEQIRFLAEQTAAVNEALRQLDPNAAVEPVLTLDLGSVDADVEVPLPLEVLDAAAEAGVNISVSVNGAGVSFNPAVFGKEVTFSVSRLERSAAEEKTDLRVVSEVFEIAFMTEDGEIAEFDEPVALELAISGNAAVNGDFLAAAKIEEGGLTIYGGTVRNGVIRVKRTSFSAYAAVEHRVSFDDTDSVEAWAGRQIRSVAAKGIVEGRGAGIFDPNAHVTRAEFAKMIAKAVGIDGGSARETFDDVTDEDWFQPYAAAVQKWGITSGKGTAATFAPNDKMTRAEMATMIARALQRVSGLQSYADIEATLAQFTDADAIHATLRAGTAFAAEYGIVAGKPDGSFAPDSFATRAEAAVMIYRMLNID